MSMSSYEYLPLISDTPRRWSFLHTICWLLNIFGIFFILAAHEHYSIDVFIAFYISSRIFLYYHALANAQSLDNRAQLRTRIWFPLFWFFESNSKFRGKVPNEYEWPISLPFGNKKRQWSGWSRNNALKWNNGLFYTRVAYYVLRYNVSSGLFV